MRDQAGEAVKIRHSAENAERQRRIEKARLFIDADWNGQGWKPSELLTIGCGLLMQQGVSEKADEFLDDMLNDARDRFRRGEPANPFAQVLP